MLETENDFLSRVKKAAKSATRQTCAILLCFYYTVPRRDSKATRD